VLVAMGRNDGGTRLRVDQWCCLRFRFATATRSTVQQVVFVGVVVTGADAVVEQAGGAVRFPASTRARARVSETISRSTQTPPRRSRSAIACVQPV
jgi:hypothetical protein